MIAKRIAVTGGAGQIAQHLLFRIAHGELLGKHQPIHLQILEIPGGLSQLEGIKMELEDGAYPILESITVTADPYQAFQDVDIALLVGAKPRGPGMERKDLLKDNFKIFIHQGEALDAVAKADAKVFVVGNPCNTNCLVAMTHTPRLNRKNFFAMTRLDQNRAAHFLSHRAQVHVKEISHLSIWGNHSSTLVPDYLHARILGRPVEEVITDQHWLQQDFVDLVQKRGAAVIQSKGKSSAASAAQALIQTVNDVMTPSPRDYWYSLAVDSRGNPYGIDNHLVFSFPCRTTEKGEVEIIAGLKMNDFLLEKIAITESELKQERDCIL